MKNAKTLFATMAIIFAVVSCGKEPQKKSSKSIEFELASSAFNGGPTLKWSTGDKIGLFAAQKSYVLSVNANSDKTTAAEVENSDMYYAITPYTGTEIFAEGSFSSEIPETQRPVKDGISYEASIAVSSSSNEQLEFKNSVGLLKLALSSNNNIVSVKLTAKSGEPISGKVKIDVETNKTTANAGNSTVELKGDSPLKGTYYAAVVPGTFVEGIEITLTDEYGREVTKSSEEFISVKASGVLDLGVVDADIEFVDPYYEPKPCNLGFNGDGETLSVQLPVNLKSITDYSAPSWISAVSASGSEISITASTNEEEGSWSMTLEPDEFGVAPRYGLVKVSALSENGPITTKIYIAQGLKGQKCVYDSFLGSELEDGWKGDFENAKPLYNGIGLQLNGGDGHHKGYPIYRMDAPFRLKTVNGGDETTTNTWIASVDVHADGASAGLIAFNRNGYLNNEYDFTSDIDYWAFGAAAQEANGGGFFAFNTYDPLAMGGSWKADLSCGWFRFEMTNIVRGRSEDYRNNPANSEESKGRPQSMSGGNRGLIGVWSLKADEDGVLHKDKLVYLWDGMGRNWFTHKNKEGKDNLIQDEYRYFGIFDYNTNAASFRNFTLAYSDKQ